MNKRIVIAVSDQEAAAYLYRTLREHADIVGVLVEKPVSRAKVFKRRVRRFGLADALGQALFVLGALPFIRWSSRKRLRALDERYGFSRGETVPPALLHRVDSVNGARAAHLLGELAPDAVVVYGTRLIAARVLAATNVPFVNIHAGITPQYRGGHGAYWALAHGRPDLCGVTVHRIDAGIDTGAILAQACISPTGADTFATYPLLQLIEGASIVRRLLQDAALPAGTAPAGEGALYAHPTFWAYWSGRRRGVR